MKEHPIYRGYLLSEDGRVFSAKKMKRKDIGTGFLYYLDYDDVNELNQSKDKNGYKKINVYVNGKQFSKNVHRMVAETYLENPHNLPHVNHIDENKENNNIENLEWSTAQKNKEHSAAKYYLIENIETGELITVYNLKKWCRDNHFHESGLLSTLAGTRKHSGGHKIIKKWEKE